MDKFKKYKIYGEELRFNFCPICNKEKEENPCFSVNRETGNYICHATGKGGNIKDLDNFEFKLPEIKEKKPRKKDMDFSELFKKRSDHHLGSDWLSYLKERGISEKSLNKFCRLGKNNTMMIPITDGEKVVAIKYRTIDKKISSEKGSTSNYFINWQNIKDKIYLIIVEGEIDLLSAIEAGYLNVVSLPFGAKNLKCIDNQKEWIESFSKIIIATDNDMAGKESQEKIIKKLNQIYEKIFILNYGKYKDFNEVLISEGIEGIKNIISNASQLSIDSSIFFGENGKFLFSDFAVYLKTKHNIIKIDNELHCYEDGIYVKDKGIEKLMIDIIPNLKDSNRKEVLKYLDLITEEKERDNTGLITFNNGIYNIFNDELLPFDPKYILTNKIPWNYNSIAYSKLMDTTLNKFACDNEKIRLLIDEIIGYSLFAKNELGKAFIITGDKSNGKSTFLKILMYMVGKDNTSALSFNDIINSRFRLYEAAGKLLNIGDDIGSGYIPEAEIFRKLVTGDIIVAEQKGKNPIKFNCYAKFIFSANDIPRIKDPTGATARRIIIIPFKNSFTKESKDYDPYFLDKIKTQECMEYMIVVGIIGLKRIIQNKGFTETEETKQLLEEFNKNNNPVLSIIAQLEDEKGEEFYIGMDKNIVYNLYYSEAQSEGMKPVTLTNFTRTMKKHKNVIVQDTKQDNQRVYFFQKE